MPNPQKSAATPTPQTPAQPDQGLVAGQPSTAQENPSTADNTAVAAHDQTVTHTYIMHYPAHEPRPGDPHYVDFNHYRQTHIATAKCRFADSADQDQCTGQLELHHAYIEFSLQNGVDFSVLEKDFPGISDPNQVGAWVETDTNFEWLCSYHHRGHGGAHTSAHADFVAERYVRDLIN